MRPVSCCLRWPPEIRRNALVLDILISIMSNERSLKSMLELIKVSEHSGIELQCVVNICSLEEVAGPDMNTISLPYQPYILISEMVLMLPWS